MIGAILQACAFTLAQMTAGRLVVGLEVGSAAMIVPVSTSARRKVMGPLIDN